MSEKFINFSGEREMYVGFAQGGRGELSSSILKYTNMAKKLAEKYPDQVTLVENSDGTIFMSFPAEWIRFPSPKKNMTSENKAKASDRLRKAREKKNEKNS